LTAIPARNLGWRSTLQLGALVQNSWARCRGRCGAPIVRQLSKRDPQTGAAAEGRTPRSIPGTMFPTAAWRPPIGAHRSKGL